jgi:hypothetical protein
MFIAQLLSWLLHKIQTDLTTRIYKNYQQFCDHQAVCHIVYSSQYSWTIPVVESIHLLPILCVAIDHLSKCRFCRSQKPVQYTVVNHRRSLFGNVIVHHNQVSHYPSTPRPPPYQSNKQNEISLLQSIRYCKKTSGQQFSSSKKSLGYGQMICFTIIWQRNTYHITIIIHYLSNSTTLPHISVHWAPQKAVLGQENTNSYNLSIIILFSQRYDIKVLLFTITETQVNTLKTAAAIDTK